MSATESQACPLCQGAATFYSVDYGQRKNFDCPSCGRFQISRRAEAKLFNAPAQWRASCASKAAETPDGKMAVITVTPVQQASNTGVESLSVEFIPKGELLL